MLDEELIIRMGELSFVRRLISVFGVVSLAQLFGAIWWALSMTTTLDYVKKDISSLKSDLVISVNNRYSITDAIKDSKQIENRMNGLQVQINKNKDNIETLHNK